MKNIKRGDSEGVRVKSVKEKALKMSSVDIEANREETDEETENEKVEEKDKFINVLEAKSKLLENDLLKKCEETRIIIQEKERIVQEFEFKLKTIDEKTAKDRENWKEKKTKLKEIFDRKEEEILKLKQRLKQTEGKEPASEDKD